jgi:quercetin dioxygenase-like cupin family protein
MEGVSIVRRFEGEALNAMGVAVRFVCRGEQTRDAWSLMECSIPKGFGPPPHHHSWDEAYFVTSGEVDFLIEGRAERVRAGDFVYAPGGVAHGFRGASEEPARMLIFDAPSHTEGFFKDLEREVKQMPADLPKVPAIGARHGIEFVRAGS